jgi:hypothetical protein
MTRRLIALTAILASLIVLQAQTPKATTFAGYIIDNACGANPSKSPAYSAKVKMHKTSCALMPSCVTSGYAVFTADGKLYKLDKAGNEQVEAILKDTQTKEGVQVQVEGTLDGDTIKATKVTEKTE